MRHDRRNEANLERFLRADDIAREEQLGRFRWPDDARQAPEPTEVGHEATFDEEFAELRPLAGDADVREERKVHTPAHGGAVDGGDDRFVTFEDGRGGGRRARADVAQAGRGRIALLAEHDLLHVVAAAKGAALAGDDDAAHLGVAVRAADGRFELAVKFPGECVHRLRTVERDGRDVIGKVVAEGWVGHGLGLQRYRMGGILRVSARGRRGPVPPRR